MITTENYEMYFLLYIDRELDAAGMTAVEQFLADNPTYQIEMDALKDTVLSIDEEDIVFPDRHLLLNISGTIDASNAEEKMIDAIHHELSPIEEEALRAYLATHPQANDSYELLQKTVLPQEHIEYPRKNILYQPVGGKVISIFKQRWLEWSAAAVILLVAGVNLLDQPHSDTYIRDIKVERPTAPVVRKPAQPITTEIPSTDNITASATTEEKQHPKAEERSATATDQQVRTNNTPARSSQQSATVKDQSATATDQVSAEKNEENSNLFSNSSNIPNTSNVQPINTQETKPVTLSKEEFIASFDDVVTDSESNLANAQMEDLKQLMAMHVDQNDAVEPDPIPIRGLIKKVAREFDKKNRSASEIRIGAFAINLK